MKALRRARRRAVSKNKRRGRDSNPRWGKPHTGFRDRPIRPLWHLSGVRLQGVQARYSSKASGGEQSWALSLDRSYSAATSFSFSISQDPHRAAMHAQLPLGEQANRFRIGLALLLENARRQRLGRVMIVDEHRALKNDGTVVVLVVGKVDGAAADLDAAGENRLVDALAVKALAAERRDQGRMNVQDAEAEILGDVNQLQEARHANEVGLRLAAEGEDALAECFCGCVILPGNNIEGKS